MSSLSESVSTIKNFLQAPQNLLKSIRDFEKRAEFVLEGQLHLKNIFIHSYLWAPYREQDTWMEVMHTVDDLVGDQKKLLLALNVLDSKLSAAQEKGLTGLYGEISQIMQHTNFMDAMEARSKLHVKFLRESTQFILSSLQGSPAAPSPPTPPSMYGFTCAIATLSGSLEVQTRNFHGGDQTLIVRALSRAIACCSEDWFSA